MLKKSIFIVAMLVSSASYGACSTSEGIELCFDLSDPDLSKVLTDKSELADIDGDEINDIIKVDPESNELMIYLGRECSGDVSSQCFRQPHFTGILNNKGFLVKDVSGDGKADLTVRTSTDQIQVYAQPGPVLDDGTREGEEQIISLHGTYGLTNDSYTATNQGNEHPQYVAQAFDGFTNTYIPGERWLKPNEPQRPLGISYTYQTKYINTDSEWIGIEYPDGKQASVNSFQLYDYGDSQNYTVNFVSLEYSIDGVNFKTYHAKALSNSIVINISGQRKTSVILDSPTPFASHFRLKMHRSFQKYFILNELVLRGWVKAAE